MWEVGCVQKDARGLLSMFGFGAYMIFLGFYDYFSLFIIFVIRVDFLKCRCFNVNFLFRIISDFLVLLG